MGKEKNRRGDYTYFNSLDELQKFLPLSSHLKKTSGFKSQAWEVIVHKYYTFTFIVFGGQCIHNIALVLTRRSPKQRVSKHHS